MDFADFTKIKTTDFAQKSFQCGCGRIHTVSTKHIIIGANAIVLLKDTLNRLMPAGKLLFICEEGISGSEDIIKSIIRSGYTLEKHFFPRGIKADITCAAQLLKHSEDIRLAVAFGGEEISDILKHYGVLSGKNTVLIPNSPAGAGYLSGISSLYINGIKQNIPTTAVTALICDLEIMAASDESSKAAAFGQVCSYLTALADWYFEKCITGTHICENIVSVIKQSIDICLQHGEGLIKNQKNSVYALTDALLRCSLCMQLLPGDSCCFGGEHHLANLLNPLKHGNKPLLQGEKVFLAHKYLCNLYSLFFSEKFTDILLPPDKALHAEKLSSLLNCNTNFTLSKMNYDISPDTYRVKSYKIEEYRADLLGVMQLTEAKSNTASVIFKRMYHDAGYWINGSIKDKDLVTAVALAADLSDRYTVLAHMRNTGMFEKYLTNKI